MIHFKSHIENLNRRKLKTLTETIVKQNWLTYAIDALKPINSEITADLIEKASELQSILATEFKQNDFYIDVHIIGGLANNTHISHSETLDFLIVLNQNKQTEDSDTNPTFENLILLRDYTKRYLSSIFPSDFFDNSQPHAINHLMPTKHYNARYYFGLWQINTIAIEQPQFEQNIMLLNVKAHCLEKSNPFLIINEFNHKDKKTNGNAKRLVRLLKNLKVDNIEPISLTGYQITSIIYNMEDYTLAKPPGQLLFQLLEVSLFLKRTIENPYVCKSLKNPDDTLITVQSNCESFNHGIIVLKQSVDDLIKKLIMEIDLYQDIYEKAAI